MMERFDVGVIGLGAMGSAACAQLALRGASVVGFEQYDFGHGLGSSGGRSRIIRKAYFEDVAYVPLLQRAYELWSDVERRTGTALLHLCGVLVVDDAHGETAAGVAGAARAHDIPVETFDAAALRARYPQLRILNNEIGILEPAAGVVYPEAAIRAHLTLAAQHGATLVEGTRVNAFDRRDGSIRIRYAGGEVRVARLVVTAGSWTADVIPDAALPLQVQRNVQYWFATTGEGYGPEELPAFFLDRATLPAPLYGMPDFGDGLKFALHGYGELTHPDRLDREVRDAEVDAIRLAANDFLPGAAGKLVSTKVCMYTNSPDHHFLIGLHPRDEDVIVAAGFSGHGYKFASAIGEVLAELALDGTTRLDIEFLNLNRFV